MHSSYRLTTETMDSLMQELADQLGPHLSSRPSQYRSDLDILNLVVSLIGSFLMSVAANQLPPLAKFKAKSRLTREDLHEFEIALDTAHFEADLDAAERQATEAIEESLPDIFRDKNKTAKDVFSAIKQKLISQRMA